MQKKAPEPDAEPENLLFINVSSKRCWLVGLRRIMPHYATLCHFQDVRVRGLDRVSRPKKSECHFRILSACFSSCLEKVFCGFVECARLVLNVNDCGDNPLVLSISCLH